ncbi:hypothetical protein GCM10011584_33070 [Nocardioides phosphati]|uniref:YCII-related domain-containing protein n=1 Tax=Nocardioides phosphati TaxID=1867775 RepID=A0ABQ2NEY2_9ACTN|nr:hypothetical protein GCM10011584_33070 [Nocardioides phosphati]
MPWHGTAPGPIPGSGAFVVLEGAPDNEIGIGAFADGSQAAEALAAQGPAESSAHIRYVRVGDWLLGGSPTR